MDLCRPVQAHRRCFHTASTVISQSRHQGQTVGALMCLNPRKTCTKRNSALGSPMAGKPSGDGGRAGNGCAVRWRTSLFTFSNATKRRFHGPRGSHERISNVRYLRGLRGLRWMPT